MELADLLAPAQVRTLGSIASKKRALEELSKLLVEVAPDLSATDVLTSLVNREKLGSTALEGGVAIPHGRIRGLDKPAAAFVRLEAGIDYDASDGSTVDLIFGLLVPQEATQTHLEILKAIAERLSDDGFVQAMRNATSDEALYEQIVSELPTQA
ncbi:PTS sugar transporter subunit IIA [uncultured Abyssibacter sp.]|uniref:PTS sugar transporter subunit IIA n=1 Tax=uncultured Abyssibacter sp. TaxID=2320202 RepID=UPI0032B1BDDE